MTKHWLMVAAALMAAVFICGAFGRISNSTNIMNNYRLDEGETYEGDLSIVARDVVLGPGSAVHGNLTVVAMNSLTIGGMIDGNLSIFAPSVDVILDSGLHVTGNFLVCSRNLTANDDIYIEGERNTGCDQLGRAVEGIRTGIPLDVVYFNQYNGTFGAKLEQIFGNAIGVSVLAIICTVIFPARFRNISTSSVKSPVTLAVVGFATMGVATVLILLYALLSVVTFGLLCLASPLIFLGWGALTLALLIGWTAMSLPLGALILHRLHLQPTLLLTTVVGVFSLTIIQGILEILPCLGIFGTLLKIVLGSVGLGAVILTRLGAQPYPEYVPIIRKKNSVV